MANVEVIARNMSLAKKSSYFVTRFNRLNSNQLDRKTTEKKMDLLSFLPLADAPKRNKERCPIVVLTAAARRLGLSAESASYSAVFFSQNKSASSTFYHGLSANTN